MRIVFSTGVMVVVLAVGATCVGGFVRTGAAELHLIGVGVGLLESMARFRSADLVEITFARGSSEELGFGRLGDRLAAPHWAPNPSLPVELDSLPSSLSTSSASLSDELLLDAGNVA